MHKVTKAALTGLILTPVLTTVLAAPGSASTTSGDGSLIMFKAGSVEAKKVSCDKGYVCFWTQKKFKGTKWAAKKTPGKCKDTPYLFRPKDTHVTITVWSLITSSNRVISSMHAKKHCGKGKQSSSYTYGKKVANAGGFKMQSFY